MKYRDYFTDVSNFANVFLVIISSIKTPMKRIDTTYKTFKEFIIDFQNFV